MRGKSREEEGVVKGGELRGYETDTGAEQGERRVEDGGRGEEGGG